MVLLRTPASESSYVHSSAVADGYVCALRLRAYALDDNDENRCVEKYKSRACRVFCALQGTRPEGTLRRRENHHAFIGLFITLHLGPCGIFGWYLKPLSLAGVLITLLRLGCYNAYIA